MHNLTPSPIRITDRYADGEDACHFEFELLNPVIETEMAKAKPGQFFMLNVPGAGAAPFTYTRLPDSNGRFVALVRNVGQLTSALFTKKPGDILGHRGPFGHGWPIEEISGKNLLIIAGGCGLAPLSALIDHLINTGHAQQVAMIYGSRTRELQVLGRERLRWKQDILFHETVDVSSKNMPQGNLSSSSLSQNHLSKGSPIDHIDNVITQHGATPDAVLCCGPEHMMYAVASHFVAEGLAPTSIWLSLERRMHCGVGTCGHCYIANSYACVDGPTYRFDALQNLMQKTAQFPDQYALFNHC